MIIITTMPELKCKISASRLESLKATIQIDLWDSLETGTSMIAWHSYDPWRVCLDNICQGTPLSKWQKNPKHSISIKLV